MSDPLTRFVDRIAKERAAQAKKARRGTATMYPDGGDFTDDTEGQGGMAIIGVTVRSPPRLVMEGDAHMGLISDAWAWTWPTDPGEFNSSLGKPIPTAQGELTYPK